MSEEEDYRRTLETATAELSALIEEAEELDDRREKLQRRITALRTMVLATSHVLGEDPQLTVPELFPENLEPEIGFTDAVREVMKSTNKYLSPVDIRNMLRDRGFNLERYRNPLAAIHQILKRLVENSKEVEKHPDENSKLYRWKVVMGTPYPAQHPGGSAPRWKQHLPEMMESLLESRKKTSSVDIVPMGRTAAQNEASAKREAEEEVARKEAEAAIKKEEAKAKRKGLTKEEIEYASKRIRETTDGLTDRVLNEIYEARKK